MKKMSFFLLLALIFIPFKNTKSQDDVSKPADIIYANINAWHETDNEIRRELITKFWTDESVFLDEFARASGLEEYNAVIDGFQEQFPNTTFIPEITTTTGRFITWYWKAYNDEEEEIMAGYDVAELNDEGKIILLIVFLYHVKNQVLKYTNVNEK